MLDWLNKHGYKRGVEVKQLDGNQKTGCLTATAQVKQNLSTDYVCVAMRGRNPDDPSDRTTGSPTEQRLEPKFDGKTNCLTSVQKDNLVMQINPSTESGGKQPYQQNRVYDTEGISPALCVNNADLLIKTPLFKFRQDNPVDIEKDKFDCLRANAGGQLRGVGLNEGIRIRRLTPTECARLQTIPDWYKWNCSSTQQYRQLGNGWTVDVIRHIFSFIDKDLIESLKEKYQYQLTENE